MTARELFNLSTVLFLAEESDRAEYEPFFIPLLNIVLIETFGANNARRVIGGKQPLSQPPMILNMGDAVPYEESFLRNIIPYGIAGRLYVDDDMGMAVMWQNRYDFLRAEEQPAAFMPIENAY